MTFVCLRGAGYPYYSVDLIVCTHLCEYAEGLCAVFLCVLEMVTLRHPYIHLVIISNLCVL